MTLWLQPVQSSTITRPLPAELEAIEQPLDAFTAVISHHLGDVGVAGGGVAVAVAMAQQRLDQPQVHPLLQQVGGTGMAQAVDREFFLDATLASIGALAMRTMNG